MFHVPAINIYLGNYYKITKIIKENNVIFRYNINFF